MYVKNNFADGNILKAEHLNNIENEIELHGKCLGDIRTETYVEISESNNKYNYTETPTSAEQRTYQSYVSQSSYSANQAWNVDNEGAYTDTPPALTHGVYNIPSSQAWSQGLTHYLKVEAGNTYLFKSNKLVTQTNPSTGVSYDWGAIKYIFLDNTGGKRVWESRAYTSNNWNTSNEEYGMECGVTTSPHYGTNYAEIIATTTWGNTNSQHNIQAYLIKFYVNGWVRVQLGLNESIPIYGLLPSGDIDDTMTEDTFATLISNFQFQQTSDISADFESYYYLEEEKQRYLCNLTDRSDDIEAQINDIQANFVKTPYYSQNLYSNIYFANNGQYLVQATSTDIWSSRGYQIKSNPLEAGMGRWSYEKNLCSGWVKLTTKGKYTIQQFKQIVDSYSGDTFGYIGIIYGATPDGTLVFQSAGYSGAAITESDYFKAITSSTKNMTRYTFEKLTDDEMYVCWFMATFQDRNPSGYNLIDKNRPVMTEEEMEVIKGNTMLSAGTGVKEFQEYCEDPLGYNYLVGIDSIDGLRDILGESGTSANALSEEITIANSDKIGFFGNSFFEGYTIEGQHPTCHLGSWLDYILYNYSQSGDDILETLERVENNKIKFNAPFSPSEFNLTYAVIAQQDNDGALHAAHYETYYENSKKLAKYLAGYGAKCILGTEHDSNGYYYNMMRLAKEEGYMFMDWGQLANLCAPANFKPFAWSGHPSTRGHWVWTYGMKQFFDTLPRPRKGIKLFNARNSDANNSDLLFNTNIERAKVWQDFSAGYTYGSNPQYFDRLCETTLGALTSATKASEYMLIQNGDTATVSSKILAEIITPYTSTHLKELKVYLNTTADKVYIKRNTSLTNPISAKRYLSFGIGDNDSTAFPEGGTLMVSAGSSGHITGSNIAGTYTIQGVTGDIVVTTTASSGRETSGTDILEAIVDGNTVSNLTGSYDYPSADYGERWNKPLCEWKEISLDDDYCFTISDVDTAKYYFDFDKVSFLLESSSGQEIIVTDVSATVSGSGEKNRETHKKITKPIVGTSLLKDVDFSTNSSKWTITGEVSYPEKLSYTQVSGSATGSTYTENYPSGTASTIQLENGTRIVRKLNTPNRDAYTAPMVQVRLLARRLPPVCFDDDIYINNNVITPTYYPCGTLKVGLNSSQDATDCDYFGAIEVGLAWNLFVFNIPLQNSTDYIHILSESDWIQIARVEVDQITNYITFS